MFDRTKFILDLSQNGQQLLFPLTFPSFHPPSRPYFLHSFPSLFAFVFFLLAFPKRKKALSLNALAKSQKEKAKREGNEERKEG